MFADILGWLSEFVLHTIEMWGYAGVTVLMALESANIPIPSEIIMPFSGFLVSGGVFNFWAVVFWGGLGNLLGSLVSYWVAHKWRRQAVVVLSKLFFIRMEDFEAAERWFEKFGVFSVFIGRFVPVVRTFISFPAGMFRVKLLEFSVLTFVGSFLWSLLMTYIGFSAGEHWDVLEVYFRRFDIVIGILILGTIVWWIVRHFRHSKSSISPSDEAK